MSVLKIVTWPDPILARTCDPIGEIDGHIRTLAENMLETMYAAEGRGLAAPQIGEALRIFVMDVAWEETSLDPVICINPEIVRHSEETIAREEGCLSIPGISARVDRPAEIRLRWTGTDGATQQRDLDGFAATCAQHELDHLDGVVTLDRLDRQTRLALIEEYEA